eukprot:jgi/Bigna1/75852/fgenesh1_pg.37_\
MVHWFGPETSLTRCRFNEFSFEFARDSGSHVGPRRGSNSFVFQRFYRSQPRRFRQIPADLISIRGGTFFLLRGEKHGEAVLLSREVRLGKTRILNELEDCKAAWGLTVQETANAVLNNHRWVACAEYLLENGLPPDFESTKEHRMVSAGGSLLHLIADIKRPKSLQSRGIDLAKRLLEQKANANSITSDGYTPMHIAVQSLFSKMVLLLLEKRGDPDLRNAYGDSPFKLASSFGVEAAKVTELMTKWRFQFQKRLSKRVQAVLTTKVFVKIPLPDALRIADIVADYAQQQQQIHPPISTTATSSLDLYSTREIRPRASKRRRKGRPLVVLDEQ